MTKEELQAALEQSEGMLEFERNKYARLLAEQEQGIREDIHDRIALELQAIFDLCDYLPGEDARRIRRRLERIDRILS